MTVAQDAEFLQQVDAGQLQDLHRSNLLRLGAEQLVESVAAARPPSKASELVGQIGDFFTRALPKKKVPLLPTTPFVSVGSSKQQPPETSSSLDGSDKLYLPRLTCVVPAFEDDINHTSSSNSLPSSGSGPNPSLSATSLLTKPSGNAHIPPSIELHVVLPDSFYSPKDYAKHRYFQKRNRVVWTLARLLAKDSESPELIRKHAAESLFWRYQYGDVRKPMIVVVQPKFVIEILVGVASLEWIQSPLRLVPNRGNLGDGIPTPHYNHAILEDAHERRLSATWSGHGHGHGGASANASTEMSAAATCAIRQAGILAKVWCLQRGLLRGHDAMHESHIVVLMLYMLRSKRVNPRLAPTQILAAWFKLLAETDWMGEKEALLSASAANETANNLIRKAPSEAYRNGAGHGLRRRTVLVVPQAGVTESSTIAQSSLAQLYEQHTRESPLTESDPPTLVELYRQTTAISAVMLDPTLTYNYLARWSPSFVRLLQREAAKSLEVLQSPSPSAYADLFLREMRFWSRYDAYLRVRIPEVVSAMQSHHHHPHHHRPSSGAQVDGPWLWGGSDQLDFGAYECISRGIVRVLTMALGDRVKEIRLLSSGNGEVKKEKDSSSADSDEIPRWPVVSGGGSNKQKSRAGGEGALGLSPTGSEWAIIGFTFNSETCTRVVDRGPPAEDVAATDDFVRLWGKTRAQLRRFKDGAIVHAVVWDSAVDPDENVGATPYVRFENDDKLYGGIVERIVRHILRLHFLGNPKTPPASLEFSLRGMLSMVDGVLHSENETSPELKRFDPLSAHRMVTKAFDSLSDFLRKHSLRTEPVDGSTELASRLGIPLAIDAVEPVSPALRYAELYPPLPHPFLGSPTAAISKENKIPGAVLSDPIEILIRFGPSSKWPTDLRAIGAAKTAMLVRILDGIESMKKTGFGGSSMFYGCPCVTSAYADVGWMGYVFRIRVRADPELKMLRSLNKPTDEASSLLRELTRQHLAAPSHHTMILSVYTSHPTASAVTRLAKRWLASHLLSGHIPFEAIELLVASVYSSRETTAYPPGSIITGFVRFLRLLGSHDWARQPLLVDPHGILSADTVKDISNQFEQIRGPAFDRGPAMYLVSPYDKQHDSGVDVDVLFPMYTSSAPERVALARASKLAERSYLFLRGCLRNFESEWSPAFLESKTSFQSFSALLRVSPEFIVDPHSSSSGDNVLNVIRGPASKLESSFTRSMRSRVKGPKELERKAYRNITDRDEGNIILHWNPVDSVMQNLSSRLHRFALFFYNEFCPNVISVVWRPLFEPRGFSVMVSENARPITAAEWKPDTLVTINVHDLMREIGQYTAEIVVDAKVLDSGHTILPPTRKRKQVEPSSDESSDSSSAGSAESESSESEE